MKPTSMNDFSLDVLTAENSLPKCPKCGSVDVAFKNRDVKDIAESIDSFPENFREVFEKVPKQTIRIRICGCKCGQRWIEAIPNEYINQ